MKLPKPPTWDELARWSTIFLFGTGIILGLVTQGGHGLGWVASSVVLYALAT